MATEEVEREERLAELKVLRAAAELHAVASGELIIDSARSEGELRQALEVLARCSGSIVHLLADLDQAIDYTEGEVRGDGG